MEAALLSDRALFVRFFANDQALGLAGIEDAEEYRREAQDLTAEVEGRFGEGAGDRLASYLTAWRFSQVEMLEWAADHTDECVEVAKTGNCEATKRR